MCVCMSGSVIPVLTFRKSTPVTQVFSNIISVTTTPGEKGNTSSCVQHVTAKPLKTQNGQTKENIKSIYICIRLFFLNWIHLNSSHVFWLKPLRLHLNCFQWQLPVVVRVHWSLQTTPTPAVTRVMKTRSHGEADSMDNFIINRVPRQQATASKKPVSCGHVSKSHKILQRAATPPGQRWVSNFYYIDLVNVNNENYLPDLVRSNETAMCIISDDLDQNEGPVSASSPSSDTRVFEHPNLSPILSDDDCIVIGNSSSSSLPRSCHCRF